MGRSPLVLSAKVRVPEVRALSRDRLNDLLERVFEHRLGMVIGPAGSGKTTFLSHFAARIGMPGAFWSSQDRCSRVTLLCVTDPSKLRSF